jgi:acyl-CoA dehydrogenase
VTESAADLADLAELCAAICGTGDPWPALETAGLTLLGVPESAGGSGGSPAAAATLLREAARAGAAVPAAETQLAAWLLSSAGLPIPTGPLTVAVPSGEPWLRRVPWARAATVVALLGEHRVAIVTPAELTEGRNVAGEPRDDLLPEITHRADAPEPLARRLALRYALARAVQLTGAAERALDLTLRHTTEREQFGRPLSRFQAVQQSLAELAGEVAVMRAATDAALTTPTDVAVAAAKTVTSQSAGTVARIAHQLLGAIGFTDEHPLHRVTTRLWSWRDEAGDETTWSRDLTRRLRHPHPWHTLTG